MTAAGPRKMCCTDPVKIGQAWSSALPVALLGSRKRISMFVNAHLAPYMGSKNKELE